MIDIFDLLKRLRAELGKKDIFLMLSLTAIFFVTRIINLVKLPIFTDEAIYIHWARLAWKDASWRFVSLTDGRQPFQTWATIPFLKLFDDPLFAGRMFGVMSGFFALVGIFILLRYLFGKKYAYLGTLIYILNPYYLFYERMALVDAAVNGFFVWTILFSLLLVKHRRLDLAIVFGLVAGLGTLTKSTMRIFFVIPLLAPLLLYLKEKDYLKKVINYYVLFAVVGVCAFALYNIQRLSPYMHFIEQKNLAFTKPFSEFIKNPFDPLLHNLRIIPYYSFSESAFLLPIFGLIGLVVMLVRDTREALGTRGRITLLVQKIVGLMRIPLHTDSEINHFNPVFLAVFLYGTLCAPFVAIALFGNVIFPRYLIFLTIPLLLGFVYLLKSTKNKMLLVLYFLSVAYLDYTILFAPVKMPLPAIDRGQYLEGNSAGYGMNEITQFIREKSADRDIYVFTEGTFGLLPYALDIYTDYINPRVHFQPRWPMKNEDFTYARNLSKDYPVYFVFHERAMFPQDWPLQLIRRFPRPGDQSVVYLFGLKQE